MPDSGAQYARQLFGFLRDFDRHGCEVIVASVPAPDGLGLAIADRLRRAAGPRNRAGLVYALAVRFLAVAHQGIESSLHKVPPAVVDSARTLGAGKVRVVTGVKLPLSATGILAAGVVVAIVILKDLPITLLLRPFGTETLPVWVWQATSESLWVQASVPSLALVAVGMVLVGALVWAFEHGAAPAS